MKKWWLLLTFLFGVVYPTSKPSVDGSIHGSVVVGNAITVSIANTLNFKLDNEPKRSEFFVSYFDIITLEDDDFIYDMDFAIGADKNIKLLKLYLLNTIEKKDSKGLIFRSGTGAGIGIKIFLSTKFSYTISMIPFFNVEMYDSDTKVSINSRLSFRNRFKLDIDKFQISSIVFYKPLVINWRNYQLSSIFNVNYKLTKIVSFGVKYVLDYDSISEKVPYTHTVLFGLKFQSPN